MTGMLIPRLGMLRNRINEHKPMKWEDVALCEEAADYIRELENRLAIVLDELNHREEKP